MFIHKEDINPIVMDAKMVEGRRLYATPSGRNYPSITTVISNNPAKKAGIAKWRARIGNAKADAICKRSTTRGTTYHSIVEDYFNNSLDIDSYKDSRLPVVLFNTSKCVLDRINNIFLQEAALYSDHLEIAGRVDCIAEFDGVLSIIDFKTAAEPKREAVSYTHLTLPTKA